MRGISRASLLVIAWAVIGCSGGATQAHRSATAAPSATPVPARASSGCATGQPAEGAETRTISVASAERTYRRYVPPASGAPVPLIAFWGKDDVLLPYCGGIGPAVDALVRGDFASTPADPQCPPPDYRGFPPVEDVVGAWASADGCDAAPELTQQAADVERHAYSGCRDGASVVLYSVTGGGHTWPGSAFMEAVSAAGIGIIGHTTDSVDASRLIWSFFERYALPS